MPRTYATLPRLFVEPTLAGEKVLELGREQSHYLGAVLRKRVGDEVIVFNGRDGAWRGRVAETSKRNIALELLEQTATQPPPPDLWYGFAPLKSARLEYVVQKATEMGAGIIQPVITRFTQVTRLRPEKLRANVIEAAEQCEVLTVPELAPEIELPALVAQWREEHAERILVVADETRGSESPIAQLTGLRGRPIGLLVGPEGGFSEEELVLLRAQEFVLPISLGPRILRADTAAVAALAVIQSTIGDWR